MDSSEDNQSAQPDAPEPAFSRINHPKKRALLKAYVRLPTVTKAAAAAAVTPVTHRNWLAADPDYAEAFDDARQQAADRYEAEVDRRAIEGTRELVLHKGSVVMVPRKQVEPDTIDDPNEMVPLYRTVYSDLLLIFSLRAMRPEKYAERSETQTTVTVKDGSNGVPPRFRAAAAADPEAGRN